MKWLALVFACVTVLFSACDNNRRTMELQALQQENDSLKRVVFTENTEMEELLGLINEIDDNFQKIKAAENYLTVQSSKSGELTPTVKERINNDMKLLAETLTKNKEQIAKLQSQLKRSNVNSAELKKLIDKMQQDLDDKTALIVGLQEQLTQRDVRIAELDEVVAALNTRSIIQDAVIERQDAALNRAYYCFGTSKELKDEKILTGGGLFSSQRVLDDGFNKAYFTEVDIREFTQLKLHAKKAKIKSNHPEGAYELVKDPETKELTLKITNVKEFWSLENYLVVEVDL